MSTPKSETTNEPIADREMTETSNQEQQQQSEPADGGAKTDQTPNEPVDAEPQKQGKQQAPNAAASKASTGGSTFSLAVSWENLKYTVFPGEKEPVKDENGEDLIDKNTGKPVTKDRKIEILKGLTGSALPGRTLAIMGSSGAGKTTFLNALADRLQNDGSHPVEGKIKFNDVPYNTKYRKAVGFVTQDDVMNQMSTPADLFSFSLRIRRGVDEETAKERVEEMLDELNLQGARDTLVGIPGVVTGLSGGERKRANIGVELIADPKILFLDEPTSGLDAVTSAKVVSLCKELAEEKNRTVIYTIHQPTAECVSYFQDLMLMCQGYCVYHGSMEDSVPYFANLGFNCPENFTPTDYYMTLLQDKETGTRLVEEWQKFLDGGHMSAHNTAGQTPQNGLGHGSPHVTSGAAAGGSAANAAIEEGGSGNETRAFLNNYVEKTGSGAGIQFSELFKRSFSNVARNKMYVAMSIVQSVFFALIAGIIFWQLTDDVTGIQDRMGVIFMVSANRCFAGTMMMINTFPPEKEVFIREQAAGAYSPAIYFLAKSFSELPVQLIGVCLESTILYFMTGLVIDAGRFFHYVAIVFMLFQGATGLGMLVSCAVDSFQVASGLAPLLMVPMMLAGGLMGSTDRLRWGWVWLEKISIIRYGFILLVGNEFRGVKNINCDPNEFPSINGTQFCQNQPKNGQEVLDLFEWNDDHHAIWLIWLCLVIWVVLTRVGCIAALNGVAKSKM